MTAAAATALRMRPEPPPAMIEPDARDAFEPGSGLADFVTNTLLNEDSPLYGPDAVASGREFVDAANAEPEISAIDVGKVCGSCR